MFYPRQISPKRRSYGAFMLETLVGIDKGDSRIKSLTEKPQEIPTVETAKANANELLLGCKDEDFQIPVTIPYNGKSFGMLIVAGKGDGKTQWLKYFAFSQLHSRFGYNLLIADPKNDYSNLSEPMRERELSSRLQRHGIQPKGFQAKYYKPSFFNMDDRKGDEYIITLKDFENLEYGKRADSLKEFLNIDEKTPAGRTLANVLAKRIPKTLKGLKELVKKTKQEELKIRIAAGSKNTVVSSAFEVALEQRIRQGLIGDDGQTLVMEVDDDGKPTKTKKVWAAHFPEDIQKNRVVVLQVDLNLDKSFISSCYIKIALATIWQDRKTYVDSGGLRGVMDNPTFFIVDEADVLCPHERVKQSPSREQMNEIMRRGRQFGWGEIAITQQPTQISRELFNHCDYLVTTRIRNKKLEELIKDKYALEDWQVEELKKLDYDMNKPYKQWVLFTGNPAKPYETFYPLPPQISMKQESSLH